MTSDARTSDPVKFLLYTNKKTELGLVTLENALVQYKNNTPTQLLPLINAILGTPETGNLSRCILNMHMSPEALSQRLNYAIDTLDALQESVILDRLSYRNYRALQKVFEKTRRDALANAICDIKTVIETAKNVLC